MLLYHFFIYFDVVCKWYNKKIYNEYLLFRDQDQPEEEKEKTENGKAAPKKQPLSLEEMIARREAEKKAQEKVSLNYIISRV